ncbi:hypothetical protein, partial [Cognatilysobacter terrigena]|uniref:hypothetical protein n=1 Tax=Cognatilysobacter terrigena TaxID=2488749 RepID=UPI001AAC9E7B
AGAGAIGEDVELEEAALRHGFQPRTGEAHCGRPRVARHRIKSRALMSMRHSPEAASRAPIRLPRQPPHLQETS